MSEQDRLRALEAENALLRAVLQEHGINLPTVLLQSADVGESTGDPGAASTIALGMSEDAVPTATLSPATRAEAPLSAAARIRRFRSLFRGRQDVYAVRWENSTKGTVGYSPARVPPWETTGERVPGEFVDAKGQQHRPLTDDVIRRHLLGEHVVGLYPLDRRARCRLVVADFDDGEWRDDIRAFAETCRDAGVPPLLEISRSGDGAHAWFFFDDDVLAVDARRLATALLSALVTCVGCFRSQATID